MVNIPNTLTLLRVILIPVFVAIYYLPYPIGNILAAIIFLLAAITDWFDGYLARKLQQTSAFGAFLDPVADKLMVCIALVLLVANHQIYSFDLAIPSCIIIGREIAISALREWMAELGKRTSVAVSYIGKVKTAVQMVAIILLLASDPLHAGLALFIGYICIYVAALLTLWSMIIYLKAAWPYFQFK